MIEAASVLNTHVTEIMDTWQDAVTVEVPASRKTSAVALYDHLPHIIHDIADIMIRYDKVDDLNADDKYLEIIENSEKHGRHRAASTHYTVDQVVREYIIFHEVLSNFLREKNGYNEEVVDLLKYVIETSILKSVEAFSESIQEMQEKLVGTLAHDIRNPLSIVQLSLEMIEVDANDTENGQVLEIAKRSLFKAVNLIESLMNGITVRAGEGMLFEFKQENIVAVIKNIFQEAQEVYKNDMTLDCEMDGIHGVFDSTAIRRLMDNLVSNAVKYGTPRTPIAVKVLDQGDSFSLSVHNYGKPISKESQENIFHFLERESSKPSTVTKSWGMGLSLVQQVAEAHGGTASLESDEKSGTTFTATFQKNFNTPGKKRASVSTNHLEPDSHQLTS